MSWTQNYHEKDTVKKERSGTVVWVGVTWDDPWYLSRFKAKVWTYGPIPWVRVLTLSCRGNNTNNGSC